LIYATNLLYGQLKLLNRGNGKLSQRRLSPSEIRFLEDAARADFVSCSIRLREGEYQYNLVRAIAAFQLELTFPDVRDLIRKSWGEEKTNDLQFVRKIQTILKKMEKSNIVSILPKKNPWQLQRYAVSSFKFQDNDNNRVVLATEEQFRQMHELLRSALTQQETDKRNYPAVFALMFLAILSYSGVVWSLVQPMINSVVFIIALSVSVICSLALGRLVQR
jgi:hypothetical protein